MSSSLKVIIVFLLTLSVLSVSGCVSLNYQSPFSAEPSSSTVLVENGVSGVVAIKDPYLNKTTDITIDHYPLATGSGVIVTGNGYILTAFHVIGDPLTVENQDRLRIMGESDIKQYLAQVAVTNYVMEQNPQLFNEVTNTSMRFDSSNHSNIQLLTQLMARNNLIAFKSYKQDIKVKLPYNNPITSSSTLNAQLVDVGNAKASEDVALLKVNNSGNLPNLPINSQRPSTSEKVTIYGYPGTNAGNQGSLQPTASTGSIVSRITNNYGILYYETNADTANGVSGGPVVDSGNKVLGLLIYGLQNNRNRQSITSDYSLFLSSDYLIKICKKNNVPIST